MAVATGKKRVADLPSALDQTDVIKQQTKHKRIAVFLDYDGTLTPIVERPEDAVLSDDSRQVVKKLAEHCTVAVVSGRDLQDVQQLVAIDGIFFAGSHGFDIAGPRDWRLQNETGTEFIPLLDQAEEQLRSRLGNIQGALVERKKFSIAVHFRQVAEERIASVEQAVDEVITEHRELRKGFGKKVFELQPAIEWHKGKALLWLLEALNLDKQDVLPIYLGDDVTDEDAFEALQNTGIGIFVKGNEGPRKTAAHYALEDPQQVRRFLQTLAEMRTG
ncbi:trehalose-phosphatase [Desulfoferrobacter suflitae]|uniref:trehalose-phosphatase n=1 Tax=Desulfoferrobacter suflitae TaxID=2865782 RepID=UPI0021648388|nr:trehalose-phosphatase [Desulfoferrobacter suflitae]MCK8603387.1 trehalose-phosphatase [Desulfoferrobacter suflitae]